jgi:hypothetical protein
VLLGLSVSLAGRAIVDFDCCIPATAAFGCCISVAEAAETPPMSNAAASATDICFLMAISR